MPRIHVEDHAIDRYLKRIEGCSKAEILNPFLREQAKLYLRNAAPAGARMRERTRAGNEQVRLDDCILVMGPHLDGEAIVTVLGPDEVESLAQTPNSDDDEMAVLNRIADASWGARTKLSPPNILRTATVDPFVEPACRQECEERRKNLLVKNQRIAAVIKDMDGDRRKRAIEVYEHYNRELGKLRDWLKADNKRIEAKKQAKKKEKEKEAARIAALLAEQPVIPKPSLGGTSRRTSINLHKAEARHLAHIALLQKRQTALREKHAAHLENMETERKKLRTALRLAVRGLVTGESTIEKIREIEPGYLVPEFYERKV